MLNKCKFEIIGHTFKTKRNLYVCSDCGLSLGKKWWDDEMEKNTVVSVDFTKPVGEQLKIHK